MKITIILCLLLSAFSLSAQKSYSDSLQQYIQDYVANHPVVKEKDKKLMSFYPANERYRIVARIAKKNNSPWFLMETSGALKKTYRIFAVATFLVNDTLQTLNIYQSQSLMETDQYKNHLFIPFTDATSGVDTYSSGRYYDFVMDDIQDNKVVIDFNKAYNPYCAYISGVYNCPIPPKENHLSVAIPAGEKSFDALH